MFEELQDQKFGVIYADPPWQQKTWSEAGMSRTPEGWSRNRQRANNDPRHYTTMPTPDIMDMPVQQLAAKDCVLLMWAVSNMLHHTLAVGHAWGFQFKTVGFVWAKTRRTEPTPQEIAAKGLAAHFPMGTGFWSRKNTELCLLFTRGKPKRLNASQPELIVAPRREHSRKPDEAYDRIEAMLPGPRLELFARTQRPGWTSWGNQVERFAEAAE